MVVGLWVGGTLLAAQAAYMEERSQSRSMARPFPPRPEPLVWDRALNPALAWSELTFRIRESDQYYSWRDFEDGEVQSVLDVWPSLFGIIVYGLLALGFFRAAARRII